MVSNDGDDDKDDNTDADDTDDDNGGMVFIVSRHSRIILWSAVGVFGSCNDKVTNRVILAVDKVAVVLLPWTRHMIIIRKV